jgi:hypothetical protein
MTGESPGTGEIRTINLADINPATTGSPVFAKERVEQDPLV